MLLEILCIYTARWSFQELYHILNHYKICRSKLEFVGVLLNRIWDQSVLKFLLPCFALHRKMFRQGDDSLLKDFKTGIVEHPSKPFKLKQWKKWKIYWIKKNFVFKCDLPCAWTLFVLFQGKFTMRINPLLFVNESGHMLFSQQA